MGSVGGDGPSTSTSTSTKRRQGTDRDGNRSAPRRVQCEMVKVAGVVTWASLLNLLPHDLSSLAKATGSVKRWRQVTSGELLLWLCLMYADPGTVKLKGKGQGKGQGQPALAQCTPHDRSRNSAPTQARSQGTKHAEPWPWARDPGPGLTCVGEEPAPATKVRPWLRRNRSSSANPVTRNAAHMPLVPRSERTGTAANPA